MTDATGEATITIEASRADVWAALTDPEAIRSYFMGATVETDWEVGHSITWSGEWKGKPYQDKGEILAFEPQERLSYSHWSPMGGTEDDPDNYHVIAVQLAKNGEGTRVTLTESNLNGRVTDADRSNRADHEKVWSTVLEGLRKVAEGG